MVAIEMISEENATGRVKEIYEEIKDVHGIDFVPNMYKVMASKPNFLEAKWDQIKAVMSETSTLNRLTKEIIAVSVSAVSGCKY